MRTVKRKGVLPRSLQGGTYRFDKIPVRGLPCRNRSLPSQKRGDTSSPRAEQGDASSPHAGMRRRLISARRMKRCLIFPHGDKARAASSSHAKRGRRRLVSPHRTRRCVSLRRTRQRVSSSGTRRRLVFQRKTRRCCVSPRGTRRRLFSLHENEASTHSLVASFSRETARYRAVPSKIGRRGQF
ncbi:hypothetical protein BHE74_00002314 [Ensete ventricosum]|nr:hypothetical protein BHE74_00002314 [Ensete ventricosum]